MDTYDDRVATAIQALATHVKYLGAGDAASTMGAVEFLAVKIAEAGELIASAISELAAGNRGIAEAIAKTASAHRGAAASKNQ
jgi:hypothetical protein